MKTNIKIGDTVYLNINNPTVQCPPMIVNAINKEEIECVWYCDETKEFRKMTFHIITLIRVNKK